MRRGGEGFGGEDGSRQSVNFSINSMWLLNILTDECLIRRVVSTIRWLGILAVRSGRDNARRQTCIRLLVSDISIFASVISFDTVEVFYVISPGPACYVS